MRRFFLLVNMMILGVCCGAVQAADLDRELGQIAGISRTCAGCHGTDGASPGVMIPIIGGQTKAYLALTMEEFAADRRPGSAMLKFARGYSSEQRLAIAAYFAERPWVSSPWAASETTRDVALVEQCAGCHGGAGEGHATAPRLAGQAPAYLLHALQEYRRAERPSAAMALMRDYLEQDLEQLTDHYSSLHYK